MPPTPSTPPPTAPAPEADGAAKPTSTGEDSALAALDADGRPASLQARPPLQRLLQEPGRFAIDQAAAVLAPGRDPVELHYRSSSRLGAPAGEVTKVRPDSAELVSPTFGLLGPGGVLPRHYTALVDAELRKRSSALQTFLDLLARRFTGLYVKAGAKYRPSRDPRLAEQVQCAALGLGTPHLVDSLHTPLAAVLYQAGPLAARSRSVERLRGMLCDETGAEVQIVEFAGGWMRLPPAEQSRLQAAGQPGRHVQLGMDALAGSQVWDPSARFLVRLGPLSLGDFKRLLPGTPLHARLVELIQLHVGPEQDFAFNPVLHGEQAPPLQLGALADTAAARLGWTSWLGTARPRRRPLGDALLRPRAGAVAVPQPAAQVPQA